MRNKIYSEQKEVRLQELNNHLVLVRVNNYYEDVEILVKCLRCGESSSNNNTGIKSHEILYNLSELSDACSEEENSDIRDELRTIINNHERMLELAGVEGNNAGTLKSHQPDIRRLRSEIEWLHANL